MDLLHPGGHPGDQQLRSEDPFSRVESSLAVKSVSLTFTGVQTCGARSYHDVFYQQSKSKDEQNYSKCNSLESLAF